MTHRPLPRWTQMHSQNPGPKTETSASSASGAPELIPYLNAAEKGAGLYLCPPALKTGGRR
jgi:hypothetical protein